MSGASFQLNIKGPENIWLNSNPEITFFKTTYKRHTNFAIDTVEQSFSGDYGFTNIITCELNLHVGIIIVDSRLMPARIGTTGVAIACAGIEPTKDLRGEKDLDGNPLKVTFQATADNLASIANSVLG